MECHLIPGVPEASIELHMVRGGVEIFPTSLLIASLSSCTESIISLKWQSSLIPRLLIGSLHSGHIGFLLDDKNVYIHSLQN
jgi:hypothetical protein